MKLNNMILPLICASLLAFGCSDDDDSTTTYTQADEKVYDMTGFARGADISWLTQLEHEGYLFYNSEKTQTECTALMREIGMNSVRYRVWVDPEEGWCNKSDVLAKCLRAQRLGMRIMIDFHYSDTWADPGTQLIPAAWLDYSTAELTQAVKDHTTEVLKALKSEGIDVEWVQVGNETTYGILQHSAVDANGDGTTESSNGGGLYSHPENYAAFINAGYSAVKSVYSSADVIVHVDRGQNIYYANEVFSVLKSYGASYDLIGLSIYPGSDWEENVENCISNIKTLHSTYGHNVMICETGMDYNDADTAYEMLTYLLENAEATGYCEGVFYWEPEAPAGYNGGYTMGAFKNNAPTHALDAFTEAAGL